MASHDALKRDLSNFRYEVMSAFRRQDVERREVADKVSQVEASSHTAAKRIASMVDGISDPNRLGLLGRSVSVNDVEVVQTSNEDANLSDRVDEVYYKLNKLTDDTKNLTNAVMEMKQMFLESKRTCADDQDGSFYIYDRSNPSSFIKRIQLGSSSIRSITMEDLPDRRHLAYSVGADPRGRDDRGGGKVVQTCSSPSLSSVSIRRTGPSD